MDKKFIFKMIQNCLRQYQHELPLSEEDYDNLYQKIVGQKQEEADVDLHDIVNDVVYEYLTG
ncbi:hypothetical protein CVD25_04885 [Bacillus canaveralius]|uniref:Uncharacterized protein n=1 Tax=Bacillus canaveralius TaxID=1403243 RepID=A0A2N5GRI2_9BACI|nr:MULTISPECIES: YqzH family protein [Bacillus]PLR84536.1 hypothetical protein CVD23_11550 [Bacillus sp. V33-4]PLR86051.1 hypothetical protein CU635_03175 [Bacillus canaveralius]PLS00170.1 hypothetical protein CVD25_04885 [Bacillus canaveralius]RSK52067.1 hypothetical protein EJA13_12880 [Bacillus canaveralius]